MFTITRRFNNMYTLNELTARHFDTPHRPWTSCQSFHRTDTMCQNIWTPLKACYNNVSTTQATDICNYCSVHDTEYRSYIQSSWQISLRKHATSIRFTIRIYENKTEITVNMLISIYTVDKTNSKFAKVTTMIWRAFLFFIRWCCLIVNFNIRYVAYLPPCRCWNSWLKTDNNRELVLSITQLPQHYSVVIKLFTTPKHASRCVWFTMFMSLILCF